MNEDLLRELIDKLKMDSSIQTETIKEKFKKLMITAYNKGFKDAQIEQIRKGCGDEFLDENEDFELMCGKHIWEKPGKVSQYNLCPDCKSALDVLVATGEGDKDGS